MILSMTIGLSFAQSPWERLAQRPSVLELDKGLIKGTSQSLLLELVSSSQTVSSLRPKSDEHFDFTPNDRLQMRSGNGLYHLGDVNIRYRLGEQDDWQSVSTAADRKAVTALTTGEGHILATADLANTLPTDLPFGIKRSWEVIDGRLTLKFELQNKSSVPLEIGALGIPMIFNNILHEKSLEDAHTQNVFYDPYIGKDAGYLQVSRLDGKGNVLLVVPYGQTPFEAYRPLLDDPTPRGITFEGFHEWMLCSKAYAGNEWKGIEQWNEATSLLLEPNDVRVFGLQFVLAPEIRMIEQTLLENKRPVAMGVPGYVVPMDVEAKLFLQYPERVRSMEVYPKDALTISQVKHKDKGIQSYAVKGRKWGRARLTVTYKDGLKQTINYKVVKPESELVADVGHFLTTEQWFDQPNDLFGRNPSVISYDYEAKKQVTQDSRAWVAGLSDEGGAGSWLAAIMKQLVLPDKEEVKQLEQFVNQTLWGNIQHKEGARKYGVKKSVFYFEPDSMPKGTYSDSINYKVWSAWNKKGADDVGRSYNYPHVAAAHWVFYRLARFHQGLVSERPWAWYLENAFHTSMAMVNQAPHYAQFGQMEGTIFLLVLSDLKSEGYIDMANELEMAMKKRADHWRSLKYPFGSEMPWDSTGQEEVYMWSDYFGYADKAEVTLNAIMAYMPTIPHWAYNGNARRYWDFLYGGKISRVERQIHHYGSALNAIPVLKAYKKEPTDLYLLRVGYGGLLGGIANVTQDGFGPCAFHSYPSTLDIDPLSGDYGSGFFGYAVNTSSYLIEDKRLGWLGFGGNVEQKKDWISLELTNGAKDKVFIAPAKLWITLDAGKIESVSYHAKNGKVKLVLAKGGEHTPQAFLHVYDADGNISEKVKHRLDLKQNTLIVDVRENGATLNF